MTGLPIEALFAGAIMRPGANVGLINDRNEKAGTSALLEAVSCGASFYVTVDRHVLAVDFDSDNAAILAARLYLWLRLRGLWPVLVASGQRGRRHLFCVIPEDMQGEAQARAKQLRGDFRRHIRPPLAPHRLAETPPSCPILPRDPDEALYRLSGVQPPGQGLRGGVLAAIEDGDRRLVSNSERIWRAAVACANRRWTLEEWQLLLETPGTALHAAYAQRAAERGDVRTGEWVREDWQRAQDFVARNPPKAAGSTRVVAGLVTEVCQRPWPGRTANWLAVYLALVGIALRAGRLTVTASERQLGLQAGLSRNATRGAIAGLEDLGLLGRGDASTTAGAGSTWVIRDPVGEGPQSLMALTAVDELHLCWRNTTGLTHVAHAVYLSLLQMGSPTVAELSKRLGLGPRTVRKHLGALSRHGLAGKLSDERWTVGTASPDEVSRRLPHVAPRAAKQADLYKRQRYAFARYVIEGRIKSNTV